MLKSKIDGRLRSLEVETEINEAFFHALKSPAGIKALNYLKGITIHAVSGPEVSTEYLRHLEGQRYLVGVICARYEAGIAQTKKKEKING